MSSKLATEKSSVRQRSIHFLQENIRRDFNSKKISIKFVKTFYECLS